MMRGCNVGSGQRRFEIVPGVIEWTNVDVVSRPGQLPDVVAPGESMPFDEGHFDYVVLSHIYEHYHLGDAKGLVVEAHRVLKPGGSLILTTPDLKALVDAWRSGKINDYIFCVQLYGAWQGEDGDDHHWLYHWGTLMPALAASAPWSKVMRFDWEAVPGMDVARDWYILGARCVK